MTKNLLKFAKPTVSKNKNKPSNLLSISKPWEVLVIDDDESIHDVTKLILTNYEFEGRKLNLTHGYSAAEAKSILQNKNDFAVLLLDVVMETDHAGLDLVDYIRHDLKNLFLRIVLRTGQAGEAPELSVITDYDINDYKEKSDFTSQKMRSCITAAIRGYRDIATIHELATIRQKLQEQVSSRNEELEVTNNKLQDEIQERSQIQKKLLVTNNQLDSIINNSQAIITLKDLNGRYDLVNKLFTEKLNLLNNDVIGKTDHQIFTGDVAEMIIFSDHEVLAKGEATQYEELLPSLDGDHLYMSVKFPLFNNEGEIYKVCCISTDISDRIEAQNEIIRLAQYDSLTNLPNRSLFIDRTMQAISRSNWDKSLAAVLFIDLDRFKLVNDTLGHDIGDELLIQVAQRLKQCIREGDSASRFGGDEFAVLLTNVANETDIIRVTEKIRRQLAEPYDIAGKQLVVTPSIGVSRCPIDGRNANVLLKKADVAMYKAKNNTKNSYNFYTHEDDNRVNELLSLEIDLRTALAKNELHLVYQPKVGMKDGKITGFEALLRWNHPTKGTITPYQFIPILEETGMIIDVGNWVIRQACIFGADLVKKGLFLKIAVNLSSKQFAQIELVNILKESGTGYSSMNYLKNFPFNTLKIDRSFIIDAPTIPQDRAIVTTIVQLAHNLGMTIVAEGVETKEQYELLKSISSSMNDTQIQGFIFSKPLSPKDIPNSEDQFVEMWRSIHDDK